MNLTRNAIHLSYIKYLPKVVEALILSGAKSATKYVDRRTVVRAHQVTYCGEPDLGLGLDLRVKIGKPNYHERNYIALCARAKVPFPVRRVRLAFFRK
jgi:hypothetical protein